MADQTEHFGTYVRDLAQSDLGANEMNKIRAQNEPVLYVIAPRNVFANAYPTKRNSFLDSP